VAHCDINAWPWLKRRERRLASFVIAALTLSMYGCGASDAPTTRLEGLVFHDDDGNTVRNDREKGLARVPVSNGREVVLTDVRGRWFLPEDGPRTPFVVAPRGWHQTESTDPDLVALQPWHASPTPTVHIGAIVDDAPPPDATIGFGTGAAPLPHSNEPDALPTAFNVGDLHVIVVDDRAASDDNLAFVEADLLHAGAARPVLMLLVTGRGELVQLLGDRPSIVEAGTDNEATAIGLDTQGELVAFGPPSTDKAAP